MNWKSVEDHRKRKDTKSSEFCLLTDHIQPRNVSQALVMKKFQESLRWMLKQGRWGKSRRKRVKGIKWRDYLNWLHWIVQWFEILKR